MRYLNEAAAAVIFALTAPAATAQGVEDFLGTAMVQFSPIESRGVLVGCSMQFAVTVRDTTYAQGDIVSLKGSVSLNAVGEGGNKKYAPSLRVGTYRLSSTDQQPLPTPDFIYAVGSGGSLAKSVLDSKASDVPGIRFAVLQFDDAASALLVDVALGRKVTLAYSRGASGLDQKAELDFSVVDTQIVNGKVARTKSQREGAAFGRCTQQLLAGKR